MSTLSELLPAGSGGKNVDFVASGTLASGQTVVLNANGTVQAVSETNVTASLGSVNSIGSGGTPINIAGYYDPDQNACVIFYSSSGNEYLVGVAGTISGSTITFGSVTTGFSFSTEGHVAAYDTTNNKGVVVYKDAGNTGDWKAKQVNVSGTTISFESGNGQTFSTHSSARPVAMIYCPNVDRFFSVWNSSSQGTLVHQMGQTSGTTTSWSGAYNSFNGTNFNAYEGGWAASLTYDPVYEAVLIAQTYRYSPYYMSYMLVTVPSSGSATATLTQQALNNYYSDTPFAAYNINDGKHVLAYRVSSGMDVVPITLTSNSAVSFTTPTVSSGNFGPTIGNNNVRDANGIGYNALHKKTGLMYSDSLGVQYIVSIDTSGSTYTTGTSLQVQNTYIASIQPRPVLYDSVSTNMFIAFKSGGAGTTYDARTYTMEGTTTNVSNFIGITDAAIANTATGSVTIKGGIGIAQAAGSGSIGTEVVYGSAGSNLYTGATFDSSNNRVVIVYRDGANSNYGTAVVGNVSGTSISFGTPVTYNTSGSTDPNAVGFDSNSNKVVVAYRDGGDSDKGKAIVGTVDPSNNSISFPSSEVEFNGGNTGYINVVFDSSNNRIVITYTDYGNNSAATAIAGTVSGNTISFGSEVVINNNGSYFTASTFDSTANKVVIAYQDANNSNYGTANVLTVDPSNNSITFGAASVFNQATTSTGLGPTTFGIAFDSTNNRTVIAFCDEGNSNFGTAVVGTISSTSITFGTKVEFHQDAIYGMAAVFEPSINKIVISYADQGNNYHGEYVLGTVSNTSISFNTAQTFASAITQYIASTFDTNSNRVVNAYADTEGPTANNGTAIVIQPAGQSENLIPNSVYYVQNDGTINTTSTGTRIGKALSSTSINLEFNS